MKRWISYAEAKRLEALVIEAYGSTCWLCRRPIDLAASGRSKWGLTLDHVLPRSLGGSNAIENLRPAHHYCNSKRRNKLPSARPRIEINDRFSLSESLGTQCPPPCFTPQSTTKKRPKQAATSRNRRLIPRGRPTL